MKLVPIFKQRSYWLSSQEGVTITRVRNRKGQSHSRFLTKNKCTSKSHSIPLILIITWRCHLRRISLRLHRRTRTLIRVVRIIRWITIKTLVEEVDLARIKLEITQAHKELSVSIKSLNTSQVEPILESSQTGQRQWPLHRLASIWDTSYPPWMANLQRSSHRAKALARRWSWWGVCVT